MSFNLVDLVKDQLTGQVKGHVSKMLGNESGKADAALGAAVPGLLKGLAQSASTPSGADSLLKAVNNQDDGLLDNLGSMLGSDKAASVIDNGNKSLGSLFGDKGVGALTGAVSGVSGLSKGGAKSVMGMVAPMVMGVIKRKVMTGGLNASGLANMLKDQGTNITKAMPSGLNDQLSSQGFLSSITGGASAAASATAGKATAAASSAKSTASNAANNAKASASNASSNFGGGNNDGGTPFWKKILPIAGVLALIWIGINLFGGKKDTDAEPVNAAGDVSADAADATKDAAEGEAAVEGAVAEGEAAVEGAVAEGEAAVEGAVAEGEAAVEGAVAEGEAAVEGAVAEGEEAVEGAVAEGEAAVEGAVAEGEEAVEGAVAEGEAAVEGAVAEGEAAVEGAVAEGEEAVEGAVAEGEAAVEGAVAEGEEAVEGAVAEGEEAVEGAVAEAGGKLAVDPVTGQSIVPEPTDASTQQGNSAAEGDAAESDAEAEGDTAESEEASAEGDAAEGEEAAAETDAAAEEVAIDRSSFSLGAISRQFGGIFGTAGAVLGGVSDAESATAALPKLEEVSGGLDSAISQFDAVPEAARGPLLKVVSNGVAKLTPLADTVLNKEGVGDVLGGVMGPMMDKLKGLAQ